MATHSQTICLLAIREAMSDDYFGSEAPPPPKRYFCLMSPCEQGHTQPDAKTRQTDIKQKAPALPPSPLKASICVHC